MAVNIYIYIYIYIYWYIGYITSRLTNHNQSVTWNLEELCNNYEIMPIDLLSTLPLC